MIAAMAKARSILTSAPGLLERWAAARTANTHRAKTVRRHIRLQLLPNNENHGRDERPVTAAYQSDCTAARAHNHRPLFLRQSSAMPAEICLGIARQPATTKL